MFFFLRQACNGKHACSQLSRDFSFADNGTTPVKKSNMVAEEDRASVQIVTAEAFHRLGREVAALRELLAVKANSADVYSKREIDNLVAVTTDTSDAHSLTHSESALNKNGECGPSSWHPFDMEIQCIERTDDAFPLPFGVPSTANIVRLHVTLLTGPRGLIDNSGLY